MGHPFSRLNASEFSYQGFGVSQELPFPGKLGLASEEAKREAESEQQKYRSVVFDLTARLKVAYYEWLTVQKAIELTHQNSDLLSRFEEIARNRYTVGKGLQQDVLKAQLEVSSLEREIAMLDEKRQRAEAEIASLLAVPSISLRAPAEDSNEQHSRCRSMSWLRRRTKLPVYAPNKRWWTPERWGSIAA